MITAIKSSRIIVGDDVKAGSVYIENGKIKAVTNEAMPCDELIDLGDLYVSAGWIDIHTHGGGGHDFSDSVDDVIEAAKFHLSHGVTSVCPTISAADFSVMARAVEYVEAAMRDDRCPKNVIGAHLEGPYLSKKQCGAQCPDFITEPSYEEYSKLLDKHGGAIARWTYAPENDKGGRFAKYVSERGVVISAGHTDAIYDDMLVAIKNGCRLVTHLYSCTSTVTRDHGFRRLGVIESALLCDELYAEIIADGKHLPPELIRLIIKAKGVDRVALVTDSLSLAGTDATEGKMMATEYVMEDGVCKLKDRSAFAGSIATADRLVRVVRDEVGLPLPIAVKMITEVPAKIMNLSKGALTPGMDADLVVFDDEINVREAWIMGECKYKSK